MIEQPVTGRLENWYRDMGSYWGEVYGDIHNRFPAGTHIHTSYVADPKFNKGDIIHTLNSTYELGEPLKAYASQGEIK